MNTQSNPSLQSTAALLGYGGAALLVCCALNLFSGWPLFTGFALQVFIIYAAMILTFIGAIRWGLGLATKPTTQPGSAERLQLLLSVLPSFAALISLLLGRPVWQLGALLISFVLVLILDWFYPPTNQPDWMRHLRLRLTMIVVVAHGLAMAALTVAG